MSAPDVATNFPTPELTPHANEKPTHLTLKVLHRQLNSNAVSIYSARGGGQYGHLSLVVPDTTFNALPNTVAFVAPEHPGPRPVHAAGASAAAITEGNRAYLANLEEFRVYTAGDNALKKLLLQAMPSTYTEFLAHDTLGYAQVTTLELLNHLDETYGTVTPDDLAQNMEDLEKPWNGDEPLENLWNRVRQCRTYAAGVDPITEATAVRIVIKILETSGLFPLACTEWRKRPRVQWTIANATTDFNQANTERLRTATSGQAGYNATAAAVQPSAPIRTTTTPANWCYCWSHGLNKSHTGMECQRPKDGHIKEATLNDMKGGSPYIYVPRARRME